jgi:SAM-dependent methyltransferase
VNVAEYERMYLAEESHWWYAGMRAISFTMLDGALAPQTRARSLLFLDAGCGTGNNLRHLSLRGHAVGVDLSEEALRFCRSRGVAVARAELLKLPFPAQTFDCVTSFDVLYHRWVEDDLEAAREMARVLRPGGLLLARVPALKLLWGAHDEAVHSRHRYTRREVIALLRCAGLEVLKATYCNTLLLPLLAGRRALDRLTGREGSDVGFLPAPLEWSFRKLLELEAWCVRRFPLPLGASVVALARRPP